MKFGSVNYFSQQQDAPNAPVRATLWSLQGIGKPPLVHSLFSVKAALRETDCMRGRLAWSVNEMRRLLGCNQFDSSLGAQE
jgi:hypothetical protein